MSFELGLLMGLGRAAVRDREERARREREERQIADEQNARSIGMLQKLVDTDDLLPDEARNVAAGHLFRLATSPKAKDKDFAAAIQEVLMAANRPRATPQTVAANAVRKAGTADLSVLDSIVPGLGSGTNTALRSAIPHLPEPQTVSGILTRDEIEARNERTLRKRAELQQAANTPTSRVIEGPDGIYQVDDSGQIGFTPFRTPPVPRLPAMSDFETFYDAKKRAWQAAHPGKQMTPQDEVNLMTESKKVYGQADDKPPRPTVVAIDASGNALPSVGLKRRFDMERQLAGEWTKANTSFREMQRQLSLMEVGLRRFKQGDPNGGSQAVLVTFQKILDPTSVVRESEYARSAEGISMIGRMEGYIDRLSRGGAGVPASELEEMVKTARQFLSSLTAWNETTKQRIYGFAMDYQLNPKNIFTSDAIPSSQASASPPPAVPQFPGKVLDRATAAAYAKKAGGDRNKARQLAAADGYDVSSMN